MTVNHYSEKKANLIPLNPPFQKIKGSMVNFTSSQMQSKTIGNPLQSAAAQGLHNSSDMTFQSQGNDVSSFSRQTTHTQNKTQVYTKMTVDQNSSSHTSLFKIQSGKSEATQKTTKLLTDSEECPSNQKTINRESNTLKHSTVKFTANHCNP